MTFGTINSLILEQIQVVRIDSQLNVIANDISGSEQPLPRSLPDEDQAPSEFRLMYFDSDGRVVSRLGAPVGKSTYPRLPDMNIDAVRDQGPTVFTVRDEQSGVRWRVRTFVLPASTTENSAGTAAVAISMETADGTIAWLRSIALIVGAVLLIGMTLVAAVVVRIGLRPLKSIELAATSIAEGGDLERRVSLDGGTEVARLGAAFNTMLDRLADAMQQLAGSEERMRTFIADASHDLRTPLTAIRGYAELYRYGAPDEATRTALVAQIETAAVRMGRLVDDLMELAEYDARPALSFADMDIAQTARDAVDEARSGAPGRDLTISGAEEPVVVRGDDAALRRVFSNLIANALIHTDDAIHVAIALPGEFDRFAQVPVRARAGTQGYVADGVKIYVSDDGPGIPVEKSSYVFERFYQEDDSRERGAGSGLGLAIVTTILDAHGGRIELLDTHRGTTFRIVLPYG
ncbi:HAMP domain-containing histidine kinase [Gordonia sp. zg691]|uniref:HAMP domain-containing sensor histidine kinase n=1 Tax=Gordonia jinghuaiqii TaxID=2758710 RepID=UPI0016624FB7|nr:HAMP domain-containing sensor histidine kinase [Gordonia jinghuaiqii]MBD0862804.1 HAMP domain-containing histidine kinase [Gordonia jinghuaiqii]